MDPEWKFLKLVQIEWTIVVDGIYVPSRQGSSDGYVFIFTLMFDEINLLWHNSRLLTIYNILGEYSFFSTRRYPLNKDNYS